MFACMFCWGSWANTFKLSGRWRFELYSYDFALGIVLCAAVAAFTLGSLNVQDLTFQDNFLIASTRKIGYSFIAGMLLCIANLLLLGAVSLSGMTVAFPISMSLAVISSAVWNYFPSSQANPMMLFGGIVCLAVAVVLAAFAQTSHMDAQMVAVAKPLRPDPRAPGPTQSAPTAVSVILAAVSGIMLGLVSPLLDFSRSGENGVSPYGMSLLMAGGILVATILFVPFFLNFPVQGAPLEFRGYFVGSKKQHFWGFFGGIVWMTGTVCYLVGLSTPTLTAANVVTDYGVVYAAAWLGILWGLLVWHDFKGSAYRVKMLLLGVFVMYGAGVAMVALAPLYGKSS
jgi:glucose uptake protein